MKNFWKLFGVIALVVTIGFMMSCSSDGDGDDDKGGYSGPLIGKWYGSQASANAEDNNALFYEFKSNGYYYAYEMYIGTYSVSGNTITISGNAMQSGTANFSISGTILTLSNVSNSFTYLSSGNSYKKQ